MYVWWNLDSHLTTEPRLACHLLLTMGKNRICLDCDYHDSYHLHRHGQKPVDAGVGHLNIDARIKKHPD